MPRVGLSADRRRTPVTTQVVAVGATAALAAAFVISPGHVEDGPVICPFRRLTGLPCPGCGLTRSWVYLAHGQVRDALAAHPFGAVAALAALVLVGAVVLASVRGTPLPDLDAVVRRPWVRVVVGAWLAFASVRLVLAL